MEIAVAIVESSNRKHNNDTHDHADNDDDDDDAVAFDDETSWYIYICVCVQSRGEVLALQWNDVGLQFVYSRWRKACFLIIYFLKAAVPMPQKACLAGVIS